MKKEIKVKINVKFTKGADSTKTQSVIKLLVEAYLARISEKKQK